MIGRRNRTTLLEEMLQEDSFNSKAGEDEKGARLKLKVEGMSHEVSHREPRKV